MMIPACPTLLSASRMSEDHGRSTHMMRQCVRFQATMWIIFASPEVLDLLQSRNMSADCDLCRRFLDFRWSDQPSQGVSTATMYVDSAFWTAHFRPRHFLQSEDRRRRPLRHFYPTKTSNQTPRPNPIHRQQINRDTFAVSLWSLRCPAVMVAAGVTRSREVEMSSSHDKSQDHQHSIPICPWMPDTK
jgi:hypothetical protein